MSLIGKLARQLSIEDRQTHLMACLSDLAATNTQVCQLIISYRRDGVGFTDNTGLTHEQEKMIAFIVSHSALIRGESFANGTVMLLVVKHPITAVSYNIKLDLVSKSNDVYVCCHVKPVSEAESTG